MPFQISGASHQYHCDAQRRRLTGPVEDGGGGKVAAQNIDGHG